MEISKEKMGKFIKIKKEVWKINYRKFGGMGEDVACRYLEQNDYTIVQRNFLCRKGEIDIIAKDNQKKEYVFIEVKTRTNLCYGEAREAVNQFKQKHILDATKYYLHIHKLDNEFVRFDVIEIYYTKNRYKVKHLKQVDMKCWY